MPGWRSGGDSATVQAPAAEVLRAGKCPLCGPSTSTCTHPSYIACPHRAIISQGKLNITVVTASRLETVPIQECSGF